MSAILKGRIREKCGNINSDVVKERIKSEG